MKYLWIACSLTLIASCAHRGDSSESDVNTFLEEMKSNIGIDGEHPLVSISALAECSSPSGEFKTLVYSDSAGRVRFEQKAEAWHLAASLNEQEDWVVNFSDSSRTMPDTVFRLFLHGHEFHMDILNPNSRFDNLEFGRDTLYNGVEARTLVTRDELGGLLKFYYRKDNLLPLGMRNTNHSGRGEPDIFVYVDQWEEQDNLSLFRNTYIIQVADTFHYRFTDLSVNSLYPQSFNIQSPLVN